MHQSREQPVASVRPPAAMRDPAVIDNPGVCHTVVGGIVAALFFARFFLPAESAGQGETLWIAALWICCGLVCAAGSWQGVLPRARLDWIDGAVALWIGCQVVSGIVVVLTTGEKRSAMNMTWEWISLGITWLIVRHYLVAVKIRRAILSAMIVTGTVLAGYGLYQHYVSHPRLVAEYGPLFDRLREATGSEAASIRQRLNQDGIPTEGPALVLFEKRLRDSREPLGLFALANTFGGCLAVCLMLAVGEILGTRRQGAPWRFLLPLFAAVVLIAWCLFLTKSRTAFLGTVVGLLCLTVSQIRLSAGLRRLLLPVALSCGAVAVAAVALLAAGGLDRQVLSEAPKSLAYRFQYWQATTRLIADHVWLGVGPGNFRQTYLKYKLPVASEEIADPHNLFFDVMATGGIGSGIGLLLFLSLSMLASYRSAESKESQIVPPSQQRSFEPINYWMAIGGVLLAFAGTLFCWGEWEDRILILGFVWIAVAWLLNRRRIVLGGPPDRSTSTESVALAAAMALAVHLLGAGGIAMPAISQILILLLAFSLPSVVKSKTMSKRRWQPVLLAIGLLTLLVGLLTTSLLPVMARRELLRQGNSAAASQRQRDVAERFFRQAAMADSWSPEPWQTLFEQDAPLANQSNESFQKTVDDLLEFMKRDPVNFWAPRMLGSLWLQKWQISRSSEDAVQIVRWTAAAHERYPTNSAIHAELAFALEAAGDHPQAAAGARAALAQDDLYHQHGHVDRYLEESIRQRLTTLATQ